MADEIPKVRVLVVDDHEDTAQTMSMLLELSGFEVLTAGDGEDGLAKAAAWKPAIVLLDLGLPKLDGFEVARRLRHDDATKSVMLIAISGYGDEQTRGRTLDAGFDHHLVKPVDPQVLLKLIAPENPS